MSRAPYKRPTAAEVKVWKHEYLSGASLSEIATKHQRGNDTVRMNLIRHGITMRPQTQRSRAYDLDPTVPLVGGQWVRRGLTWFYERDELAPEADTFPTCTVCGQWSLVGEPVCKPCVRAQKQRDEIEQARSRRADIAELRARFKDQTRRGGTCKDCDRATSDTRATQCRECYLESRPLPRTVCPECHGPKWAKSDICRACKVLNDLEVTDETEQAVRAWWKGDRSEWARDGHRAYERARRARKKVAA